MLRSEIVYTVTMLAVKRLLCMLTKNNQKRMRRLISDIKTYYKTSNGGYFGE